MIRLATADASGGGLGSQADEFAMTIVKCEGAGPQLRVTQEVSRGWRGGRGQDLTDIVGTIADLLRRRGLDEIHGDAYAGQWVQQAFAAVGIQYRVATLGQAEGTPKRLTKSQAYCEAEPLFAQGRVQILDDPILIRQLKLLERRPQRGGQVLVDHPKSGHDDRANALCLALALAVTGATARPRVRLWGCGDWAEHEAVDEED
jgi:hypothetical protein